MCHATALRTSVKYDSRGGVCWVQVKVQFSRIKCRTLHAARAPVPFLKYNSQVRLYSIIGFTHTNTSTISHVSQNEEPSNTHSLSHTHKTSVLRQVITPCGENSPAHVQLGAERGSRHSRICILGVIGSLLVLAHDGSSP